MMSNSNDEEMTAKEKSYEPIRITEIDLQTKKEKWLRKHGWQESCDYVDSRWRWSKTIDGKLMACSMNEAIRLERDFVD